MRQTNADLDQKHCFFLADLRLADWDTKQIVDLRLRHVPKNLRICD
jgi:hypothetical protein